MRKRGAGRGKVACCFGWMIVSWNNLRIIIAHSPILSLVPAHLSPALLCMRPLSALTSLSPQVRNYSIHASDFAINQFICTPIVISFYLYRNKSNCQFLTLAFEKQHLHTIIAAF